jgi:hypothetical protein
MIFFEVQYLKVETVSKRSRITFEVRQQLGISCPHQVFYGRSWFRVVKSHSTEKLGGVLQYQENKISGAALFTFYLNFTNMIASQCFLG